MVTPIELGQTLKRVEATAAALARHFSLARSRELRAGLEGLAWMLSDDIQQPDTPAGKEARRQLRIETVALIVEIETAQRAPSATNHSAVSHRAKAWNELLQRLRLTFGIEAAAELRGGPALR
jgi:hypothetical protein